MTLVGVSSFWVPLLPWLLPLTGALLAFFSGWLITLRFFHPVHPVGSGRFRLQSVVSGNAQEFSLHLVNALLPTPERIHLLFQRLEPEVLSEYLLQRANARVESLVDEVLSRHHALLWENLPRSMKVQIYERVRHRLPSVIDGIVEELCEHIDDLVDVRALLCRRLVDDSAVLVRLYREVMRPEMRRLEYFSALGGALLGCISIAGIHAGMVVPSLLVTCVGATVLPAMLGGYFVFGRQRGAGWLDACRPEMEERLASLIADDLISVSSIFAEAFVGPSSGRAAGIVRRHMESFFDDVWWRPLVRLYLGAEGFAELRLLVRERAVPMILSPLRSAAFERSRKAVIVQQVRGWLGGLSLEEFSALGRGLFSLRSFGLMIEAAILGAGIAWGMASLILV